MSSDGAFRVLSLFDADSVPVVEGQLQWVPVRRRLGIRAFGTNAYRAARAGDLVVEDHVESPGQEEMYLVVRGRARFEVGGESVDVPAGAAIFLPDPQTQRSAVATEDETVIFAVGGWPGQPYRSLPWEPIFLAEDFMRRSDWQAAVETLERDAGDHRNSPFVRYEIACCRAQLGEDAVALEELRSAVEQRPQLLERAAQDERLARLRQAPGWPSG